MFFFSLNCNLFVSTYRPTGCGEFLIWLSVLVSCLCWCEGTGLWLVRLVRIVFSKHRVLGCFGKVTQNKQLIPPSGIHGLWVMVQYELAAHKCYHSHYLSTGLGARFTYCPSSQSVLARGDSVVVWWPEPIAYARDGKRVDHLMSNFTSGSDLHIGEHTIEYTIEGGESTTVCIFEITVERQSMMMYNCNTATSNIDIYLHNEFI